MVTQMDVHPKSVIGQLEVEAAEAEAQVLDAEETLERLQQQKGDLDGKLDALPATATIERAGALLTQVDGVTWLVKRARKDLRNVRDDAKAVKDQLEADGQTVSKLQEELEQVELPELGWTQDERDLHGAAARARLHWLQGAPAEDEAALAAAQEALEGYDGRQSSLAGTDQQKLRHAIRQLEKRISDLEGDA